MILPFVFLCLSITLVAQASITIQTYMTTGKTKDLNYYWSCVVLSFAIVGLLASGYMLYKASRPTADQLAASLRAQASAAQAAKASLEQATKAATAVAAAPPAAVAAAPLVQPVLEA
jgi:hypothetical protein